MIHFWYWVLDAKTNLAYMLFEDVHSLVVITVSIDLVNLKDIQFFTSWLIIGVIQL